eukprot:Opistho-2@62699
MRAAFALVLVALACVGTANAFQIVVDAHAEECFFDVIKKGTKMALAFQVSDGGFLDIDVKILGPDHKPIFNAERESEGRYTFAAHMDGRYTYCFGNKMSTMTPKTVAFSMDIHEPAPAPGEALVELVMLFVPDYPRPYLQKYTGT